MFIVPKSLLRYGVGLFLLSIFIDKMKIVYYMEMHFQCNTDFDYNGNAFHIGRGEMANFNLILAIFIHPIFLCNYILTLKGNCFDR